MCELAARVGLHPNTTREHLDQLTEAGFVVRDVAAPEGRGRPALLYRANAAASDDAPAHRALARVLAKELAERPDAASAAVRAGEQWSRMVAEPASDEGGVEQLVDLLADLGFAPEYDQEEPGEVRLRRCPFGAFAREQSGVVCGAHLGLIRGALKRFNAPFTAADLVPFVGPNLCVAHIEPMTATPAAMSRRRRNAPQGQGSG